MSKLLFDQTIFAIKGILFWLAVLLWSVYSFKLITALKKVFFCFLARFIPFDSVKISLNKGFKKQVLSGLTWVFWGFTEL